MSSYLQSTSSTVSYPVSGLNSTCKAWVIKKFFFNSPAHHIPDLNCMVTAVSQQIFRFQEAQGKMLGHKWARNCNLLFIGSNTCPQTSGFLSFLSFSCFMSVEWIHSTELSEANILALHLQDACLDVCYLGISHNSAFSTVPLTLQCSFTFVFLLCQRALSQKCNQF